MLLCGDSLKDHQRKVKMFTVKIFNPKPFSLSQGNDKMTEFQKLVMSTFGKRSISEDEESDDMGTTKTVSNKKTTTKKKKRNITKQEEAGE
ncbi:hypothetical protein MFLAVUS_010581 [Mucor flavus]|uniref:Uncharacterized protein n=1 Tax=Mucor flavus TaxID=439312 RepID=A0ABP9ZD58_9FUNG